MGFPKQRAPGPTCPPSWSQDRLALLRCLVELQRKKEASPELIGKAPALMVVIYGDDFRVIRADCMVIDGDEKGDS